MEWLAPHPPLALLATRTNVTWLPWTGGTDLSDRHAVMPRAHAEFYLSRWNLLRSSNVSALLPLKELVVMSPEALVLAVMQLAALPFGLFPMSAHVGCCTSWQKDRCWQGRLCEHAEVGNNASASGKYAAELRSAAHHTRILRACAGAVMRVGMQPSHRGGQRAHEAPVPVPVVQILVPAGDGGKCTLHDALPTPVVVLDATQRAQSGCGETKSCGCPLHSAETHESAAECPAPDWHPRVLEVFQRSRRVPERVVSTLWDTWSAPEMP